jgi:hypothetical protein
MYCFKSRNAQKFWASTVYNCTDETKKQKQYFRKGNKMSTKKQTKEVILSSRAMLVNFTMSTWTGRVKDRQVTNEVTINKNADNDCGAWWTYLIPKSVMKELNNAAMACRLVHYKWTLPWQDGGCRILPAAAFLDYSKSMRDASNKFYKIIDNFIKVEYPEIVKNAEKRLGRLMVQKLPDTETIREKFSVSHTIFPLPDANDFRVDIADVDVNAMREEMNNNIQSTLNTAMASVWDQLNTLVGKIESTLKEPDKIFRDTLISNLSDFCMLIPKLNVTEDKKLEKFRKEAVEKLASLKPSNLREDKLARKNANITAKELLNKLKDYGM